MRDSVILLGASGAGKGAYIVVNRILDSPGPVVVTSIRPDVLTPTLLARTRNGRPAWVVATEGALDDLPETAGWSPIPGCRDGLTAYERARVLAAGTSAGVENGDFWEGQTRSVLQFLLHAADLTRADIDTFWRWTLTPGGRPRGGERAAGPSRRGTAVG